MHRYQWQNQQDLTSRGYTCGYCDRPLASARGWSGKSEDNPDDVACIFICHHCTGPTLIDHEGRQWPGAACGNAVDGIPRRTVSDLYDEARRAAAAGAHTAAVLCCRKLLMNLAVSKGAQVGQSFASYIDYLTARHYIAPDAKDWVDHIRAEGGEASHEILIMCADDARDLLAFCEMLLKTVFEFPAAIRKGLAKSKHTLRTG